MSTDTMHQILESSLAKAMGILDPESDCDGSPMQRLNALADRAKSGFPLLIIAYQDSYTRWDEYHPAYHETIVIDDAQELVGTLGHLEATRDLDSLEFYRLAAYSRDLDGNDCDHEGERWNVMSDEESEIMDARVKISTADHVKAAADAKQLEWDKAEIKRKSAALDRDRKELSRLQAIVDAAYSGP